jgi:hypothetical protein
MIRFAMVSFLVLCLFCLTSAQVSDPVASVAGTSWAGIVNAPDSAGRFQDYAYEFEFLAGNRLRWRWRGTIYVNDSWQQNGNEILLELNDSSSTWRGTIEGNRISGISFNKEGYKWNWVLIRQTRALPQSAQIIPPPSEWIQYSSPAGRFHVLLPTEPRVTDQALNVGSVKLPNNVFLSLTQLAVFGVSYADFPTNTWKAKTLLGKYARGSSPASTER